MDWIPTAMPHFNRYIGIDYSGAETPDSSCRGLRVYVAEVAARRNRFGHLRTHDCIGRDGVSPNGSARNSLRRPRQSSALTTASHFPSNTLIGMAFPATGQTSCRFPEALADP